jgi:protein phosphatase 1 regulatory subunit 7
MAKELSGLPSLKVVYFEGNPLEIENRAAYRRKVHMALPKVKQIDAGPVTSALDISNE